MNYKKIYEEFLKYFKNSSPIERLKKRNPKDKRLYNNEKIYTEKHHILPKSLGGNNNDENLVELLPEEHLFIHQLRYKVFNKREDMLAVRFILNGLIGEKNIYVKKSLKSLILNKKILQGYAWIKTHSYNFRKNIGWHSEEGLKNISNASKNKIVVKDKKTNIIIGKVNVNHQKILSGEWVHHTYGTINVFDIEKNKIVRIDKNEYLKNKGKKYLSAINNKGKNNPNYKVLTKEIENEIFKCISKTLEENHFIQSHFLKCLKENVGNKFFNGKISMVFIKNKYGNVINLLEKYNKITNSNIIFEKYFVSKKRRDAYSKKYKIKKNITKNDIFYCFDKCEKEKHIFAKDIIECLKNKLNIKLNNKYIRNNFGEYYELVDEYNKIFNKNLIYNPKYLTKEMKKSKSKKISESNKKKEFKKC